MEPGRSSTTEHASGSSAPGAEPGGAVTERRSRTRRLGCSGLLLLLFAFGPYWTCGSHGRVVDAATGEPVAGAMVVTFYQTAGGGEWGLLPGHDLGYRWTRTDEDGAFRFYPRPLAGCGLWRPIAEGPYLHVIHPNYGKVHFRSHEGPRFEVERRWKDPQVTDFSRLASLCRGYPRPLCFELCLWLHDQGDCKGRFRR